MVRALAWPKAFENNEFLLGSPKGEHSKFFFQAVFQWALKWIFLLTELQLFDILLNACNSRDREQYLRILNRMLNPVFINL